MTIEHFNRDTRFSTLDIGTPLDAILFSIIIITDQRSIVISPLLYSNAIYMTRHERQTVMFLHDSISLITYPQRCLQYYSHYSYISRIIMYKLWLYITRICIIFKW